MRTWIGLKIIAFTLISNNLLAQNQVVKTYYEEQKLKVKEVIQQVNGVKNGPYQLYYESGSLALEGNFSNGKREGVFVDFFPETKDRY